MSDSDDESSKLDQSVVFVNEVKEKQPKCTNQECSTPFKFKTSELIVRCLHCQGCYHPSCAKLEHLELFLGFMNSQTNREHWRYVCEFCKREVHTNVRVKQLAISLVESVENNHKWLSGKTTLMEKKLESFEAWQNTIEKSLNGTSSSLNSIEKKMEIIPKEQEKVILGINEITMNNAFCNNKFLNTCEITKSIEEKVDSINFATKKIMSEDGWNLVQNKKKKNQPSYSAILKAKPNNTVDELKKQMIQNFVSNEVNVTKIFSAGKDKLIAVCRNEEDQRNFVDVAKQKFGGICEVTTPDKKNRRIKALNIEIWTDFNDLSNEEIEKHVKEENVFLAQAATCKVLNFKKARINGKEVDSRVHIFIEVDAKTFEIAMEHGKIKYLYQEPRIVDGFTVGRCYNCLSFNHKKEACPAKDKKTCFNCGGEHLRNECKQINPTCVNCMRANAEIKSGKKLDINHSVSDYKCPCYVRKLNFLASKLQ
jgi:hypothetical protein